MDVVKKLDLAAVYGRYEGDLRGYPPYHPQMMVALLLYGYCVGVPSSRKIEKKTYEDIAFRVIAGGAQPDHSSISEFRRVHLNALAELFVQVLRLCQAAGMVKLGHVSLDGTKVKANASKHKAMSYERMQKDEQRLREGRGSAEGSRSGGRRGGQGARQAQARRRAAGRSSASQDRLARIDELNAALEAEARAQHEAEQAAENDDRDPPPPGATPLPTHKVPRTKDGTPGPKSQRNFTDPESRIMKSGDGFVQGYNCQAAVDAEHQIIVAQAVTNQSPDVEHLIPMVEKVVQNCEAIPEKWSADAGYFSEQNVVEILKWKIDPYIATGRRKHDEPPPSVRGRPSASLTIKQRMARKLATKRGAAVYARRKVIPEPVFGQIKEARGFRRFLLRGLVKVRGEWSLVALTHNLLKLHLAAC